MLSAAPHRFSTSPPPLPPPNNNMQQQQQQQPQQLQQHYLQHEPAWMREGGEAIDPYPLGAQPYETTPLRGSRGPSSAASSVGRPSKGGRMLSGDNYRAYIRPADIKRGWFLNLFVIINAVCVVSALSVAVAEILSIIYHKLTPQGIAIRVYGVLFSFGVIFTEMGWTQAIRDTWLLQSWVARGVIYVFVGLLALEEQQAEHNPDINIVNFYILCAGFGLVGLGILYFFMGILCLKRVRDRKAADYTILKSQAELEDALRRHMGDKETQPYQHAGGRGLGGGYTSVVI